MVFKIIMSFLFITSTCCGQAILKNINPVPCNSCGSYPMNFVKSGNNVYFIANDDVHGWELWRTDGTESGTSMVKDINPVGDGCGVGDFFYGPYATPIFSIGDKVVFFANDQIHGWEPWKSDGTESGTQMLLNIDSSSTSSVGDLIKLLLYNQVFQVGNNVVFRAIDNGLQKAVWVTDGSTEGTYKLSDDSGNTVSLPPIGVGWDAAGVIGSGAYINTSGKFYKTDGTPEGTHLVSDNVWGSGEIILAGNHFFCTNEQPETGIELLAVDTSNYSSSIFDINPGLGSSTPHSMVSFNNQIYFWADDAVVGSELWVSNGTLSGTHLVKDLNPGLLGSDPYSTSSIVVEQLYFIAYDSNKFYLWKSDGTSNGTLKITDPSIVEPYNKYTFFANQNLLHLVNDQIYFPGISSDSGIEIWRLSTLGNSSNVFSHTCDGSCFNLNQSYTGAYGGYKSQFYFDGSLIYFAARDSINGEEPWMAAPLVGIEEQNNLTGCLVFPNPVSELFTLKLPPNITDVTVILYDVMGRTAKTIRHFNSFQTNITRENLSSGIYFLKLFDKNQHIIYSQKLCFR